jgi:peptide/nickel transport system substrate-binding protein
MRRRDVLQGAVAAGVASGAGGLARPALAQKSNTLVFAPQADLANPDPIWTTATVATIHGYMIWDTLYGIDDGLIAQPQMVEGHEVSADGLTWRLKLREGLKFHDGAPVRSADCIASIARWGKRNGFGQQLSGLTNEMVVVDDRSFDIKLKKKFPVLPYALGANGCFIMPERMAKTDAFQQITEYVGSGPFRFLQKEWVSGSSAAYAKFEDYVPRTEPASMWAGGKVVHVDRVEWKTMPDPATKAAALQTGEIDWWENPIFDLLPTLEKDPNIEVRVLNKLGALGVIGVNHTLPPFNNRKLLRALWPALSEQEYIDAVLGEQAKYGNAHAGFFTPGSPYATDVGMEILDSKRDIALAKKLVAESGYKGETVMVMSPSDQPQLQAMALVTADLFKKIGITVDYQSMDWGTLVGRRAKRDPVDKGGWNCFCTTWSGLAVANPGSSYPMRGNGYGGWFGWPVDPGMEALRDAWFDAPDLKTQQFICMEEQILAFHNVPFYPTGHWTTPSAFRKNITGIVNSTSPLFWNLRKG